MIEEDIQKLTAAITQLTVTTEALLETLRSRDVAAKQDAADDAVLKDAADKLIAMAKAEPKPKKAKAPKVEEPAPAPEPAPEPAPAPETSEKQAVTLQQIRAAAQQALDLGKVQQIVAINKQYGLKRVSDASPDQYPEILAKLEEINGQA